MEPAPRSPQPVVTPAGHGHHQPEPVAPHDTVADTPPPKNRRPRRGKMPRAPSDPAAERIGIRQLARQWLSKLFSPHFDVVREANLELTSLLRTRSAACRKAVLNALDFDRTGERIVCLRVGSDPVARDRAVAADAIELHLVKLDAAPLPVGITWLGRLTADHLVMVRLVRALRSPDAGVRAEGVKNIPQEWATERARRAATAAGWTLSPAAFALAVAEGLADVYLRLCAEPLSPGESLGENIDRLAPCGLYSRRRRQTVSKQAATPDDRRNAMTAVIAVATATAAVDTRVTMIRRQAAAQDPTGLDPFARSVFRTLVLMADQTAAAAEPTPPGWVVDSLRDYVSHRTGTAATRPELVAALIACRGAVDDAMAVHRAGAGASRAVVTATFAWLNRLGAHGMPAAVAAEMTYARPDAPVSADAARKALDRIEYYFRRGRGACPPPAPDVPDEDDDAAYDPDLD